MSEHGFEAGQTCGRNDCTGVIVERQRENCYCHRSPPCHYCVTGYGQCPECDWDARDDDRG